MVIDTNDDKHSHASPGEAIFSPCFSPNQPIDGNPAFADISNADIDN